ncbi:hypothetical protein KCA24_35850, partial [Escherichia coli]|nr:hypothetical protein [Escherichia coli]
MGGRNTVVADWGKAGRGGAIGQTEEHKVFSAVVRGELKPEQLAAALVSMKIRGEHPNEIAGAATALLENPPRSPRRDYRLRETWVPGGWATHHTQIFPPRGCFPAAVGGRGENPPPRAPPK